MNKHFIPVAFLGFSMVALLCVTNVRSASAQFTQNRERIKIDTSGLPPEIYKSYNTFKTKCGECHTLDTCLKPSLSSKQWTAVVKQMQAMASSHLNDKEAQSVLEFLNYDETHRKAALKSQAPTAASGSITAGQAFYSAQGCDTCHSIAGKGGDMGPALNGVGAKLSRDQLLRVVKDGKANTTMPALPSGTADQQLNELMDFLASLK
ncbi:MAG TPA: c-type cytochrome [Candidatus Dormibacteraeota bacterium]|nr:c-type cytochrome [Candidatus Dormibacteraeota bacterium]